MLDYGIDRAKQLVRQSVKDIAAMKIDQTSSDVDEALGFFDRTSDHYLVREAMKKRFATGIVKQPYDDAGVDSENGYQTYRKGDVETQIDSGHIEVVTTGLGGKIISSLANLFTQTDQRWTFVDENGATSEDAEALIHEHREVGKFSTALVVADWISCGVNGSFLMVDFVGGRLKYHAISPSCVNALYHNIIVDNGIERAVDYTEMEDATAIVIRLSQGSMFSTDNQYIAFLGRSELYPFGRRVTYRASQWDKIPDPGMGGVDYTLDSGEIANPLSWYASQNPDMVVPEYPIISLDGGFSKTREGLVTMSTSLYENCLEIDIAMSRIAKDSLNAARGVNIVTNEANRPLPRCLEGNVSLSMGQTLEITGRDASHSVAALEIIRGITLSISSGYNVPGYHVAETDISVAPSGISLMIQTQPLINFRNYRIQSNKSEIARLFNVERATLNVFAPESTGTLLDGVDQVWDPGTISIPEEKRDRADRLKVAQDSGFVDFVSAVREYNNLPTDADAMDLIDQRKERAAEYGGPQQRKVAPTVGLVRQ